ncbi:MAG TPA: peptidoglycan N-acetylglucosamine deacetylase [Lachnospiraceae bacterium]|nr:peptidoglycan N-acetylglucosamine deacetylase [Lachnospiraceae bacterium]
MKKILTAILLFDMAAGLLFSYLYGMRSRAIAADSGMANVAAGLETEDVRKIAITFDDGPHPRYTEQLLDGLKERGVVATFFVTGEHAELHPEVIERMKEEGHLVGNHTYSHIQLTKNNREAFKKELIKTNEILKGITGEEVQYVRPPYGSWDKSFEKELNMFPVLWTVDTLDWSSRNVGCITEKIVSKTGENDIILMHDYYETSVTAALKAIDKLLEEGYTFVTVEEILFD